MSSLSLFQQLPTLVVDTIIEYLGGHPRVYSSKLTERETLEKRDYLLPLTTVSAVWRSAALSLICETCVIIDDGLTGGFKIRFPALPKFSTPLLLRNAHRVRNVVSSIYCIYSFERDLCNVLSRPQCRGVSFPRATTFKLLLQELDDYPTICFRAIGPQGRPREEFEGDGKVKLVRSHLRLAPNAVNIGILANIIYNSRGISHLRDKLILGLCEGRARNLGVSEERNSLTVSIELHSMSELTVMDGPNSDVVSYLVLAHLNSRTLTALHTKFRHENNWHELVYGDSKAPAFFTCLKTLTLDLAHIEYDDKWDGINGVAIFPNLSTLEVTGAYPFTDDLLFRGNGSSLQTLYLPFKTVATDIFGDLGILEREGVKQMKQIRFGDVTKRDKIIVEGNGRERIARQLHRILNVATSLRLGDDGINNDVYLSIVSTPSVTSISHLDIRESTYHHDNVISIIRALPNLVSFTVAIAHISEHGPVPDRIKMASDLHEMYYPLGSNFRILRVPSTPDYSGHDIAEEAIRIAIVCKNPVQFHIPPDKRGEFRGTVSRAIASAEFAPFADLLRHLL